MGGSPRVHAEEKQGKGADTTTKEGKDGKDKKKAPEPTVSFGTLFRYATCTDYVLYGVGTIAGILNGLTMPGFSLVFGDLLDAFNQDYGADIMPAVTKASALIIGVAFASWLASYIEVAFFTIAGERQIRVLRERYFSALVNQDIAWFDKQNSDELVTKVAEETRLVREGIGGKLGLAVRFLSTFIGGFVLGFLEGWQLTLVLMAMAPLLAIAGGALMTLMSSFEKKSQEIYATAGAEAQERLASIRTVQAFGGQKRSLKKYSDLLKGSLKAGVKKSLMQGGSMGFTYLIMFATYGLAFWFGAKLISDDREDVLAAVTAAGCSTSGVDFGYLCTPTWEAGVTACRDLCASVVNPCILGDTCHTGGNVVLVFFAVLIGAFGIGQANPSFAAMASAKVAGHKVFAVIDNKVAIDAKSDKGTTNWSHTGSISIRNATFHYPSRPDKQILFGVDLDVEPGTTVALVGRSGCGKSTIVSLIQRFYDVEEGDISIDGHPIKDLHVASLRNMMGYVGQEPVLFATTIANNIMYGSPGSVTQSEVETAARQANAHDFIMAFPDGYNTMVGQGGMALSGGQKQRVAIARALIRKPKILLLDEATSALDSTSEHVVQQALDVLMASSSHTTVVIAHRLSTIKNADKIVVMDTGVVAEQGTHDELMAMEGGIYRDLVEAQSSGRDGALAALPSDAELKEDDVPESKAESTAERNRSASKAGTKAKSAEQSKAEAAKAAVEAAKEQGVDMSIWRIFKMNKPEWGWMGVGFICACLNGAVMPAFALAFSEMIALFYEPNLDTMRDDAVFWAIMFCVLAGGIGIAQVMSNLSFGIMGERLSMRLRIGAYDAMLHHHMAFHDQEEHKTGALTTQLATDATLINAMAGQRTALGLQSLTAVVFGLILAFSGDWRMTLIVLACGPVIAFAQTIQMKVFTGHAEEGMGSLEEAGHIVQESVHGMRTVAAFNLGDRLTGLYAGRLELPKKLGVKGGHTQGFGFGFSQFVNLAIFGLTFYIGGLWVDDGSLTFDDMMLVVMSVMMAAQGMGEASSFAPDAAKAKIAMSHIFTLLDKRPDINCQPDNKGEKLPSLDGRLQFSDVVFEYPTRKGRILNHFDLDIAAGSSVALVGTSGSGKSTLIQLLQRFYDPQNGTVSLDGRDLKTVDAHWLRRQIGIVSQEPNLFNGTIHENIAYGIAVDEETVSRERVEAAARSANAHDFIEELGGYDTVIKPDSLSGGQKQRVAIARAILRSPKLLLLDEATSALDNRSEKVVQEALDRLTASARCTTVVIAHRLSTIKDCDTIVVMEHGSIRERGSHADLVAMEGGKYRSMWEQQVLVEGE